MAAEAAIKAGFVASEVTALALTRTVPATVLWPQVLVKLTISKVFDIIPLLGLLLRIPLML